MEAKANTVARIGVLALACTLATLSSIGCQSSQPSAVSPTNPMCPICGRQAQAPTGSGYTRAVCPTCGAVSTVDPDFLDRLNVYSGGPVGDPVYACAQCGTIVQQCAACRQKNGTLTSRDTRGSR
jgi:predicted RNA-binding Zn-ribbon protein involved in translation (DUF1610 family)